MKSLVITRSTVIRDLTLLSGSILSMMAGAIVAPILPDIQQSFVSIPNAEALTKLIATLHALFIAISAPFWGILLDKWGRKPVLILTLVLYSIVGTVPIFIESIYTILFTRALLGIAAGGTMSGFLTLIGDFFHGKAREHFMGLQSAFIGFSAVIVMILSGVIADTNWKYSLFLYLFGFLVLPFLIFIIKEPGKHSLHEKSTINNSIKVNIFIRAYGIAFLGMVLFYFMIIQVPFFLKTLPGITNSRIGISMSVGGLSIAVASLQYKHLRKFLSVKFIFILFLIFMGTGYILIGLVRTYT
ncbi:MAG: MFS transporter, partial [Spirochaetales bacterium]|nr:MFS transporter [Spirochaetales bacterium]